MLFYCEFNREITVELNLCLCCVKFLFQTHLNISIPLQSLNGNLTIHCYLTFSEKNFSRICLYISIITEQILERDKKKTLKKRVQTWIIHAHFKLLSFLYLKFYKISQT